MKRIHSIFVFLLGHLPAIPASGETKQRPIIGFILADDQRMDELGSTGHPVMKTPNIGRLAREGEHRLLSHHSAPAPCA